MFDWVAVIRAEMPKAMAMRNQNVAPTRARSPISWQTLSEASPETSNCPAIDCQLAPIPAIYMVVAAFFFPG